MTDLSGRRRFPVEMWRGKGLYIRYVKLSFAMGEFEIDRLLLDTGLTVPLLGPSKPVSAYRDDSYMRPGTIRAISQEVLKTDVLRATLMIGDAIFETVDLHTLPNVDEWVLGLPVLSKFHLFLHESDKSWPLGPQLVMPPLSDHLPRSL